MGGSLALQGLNSAQEYAVTLGDGPILVIAGAGTGKTRTLVHRLAWLAEQGLPPENVLLLTFTRRAAEEMLSRARSMHQACASVSGGTFHSLANRLLRRHGGLIGLPGAFTIIDPADCEQIIRSAVDELGLKEKGDRRFPRPRTMADIFSKSRNMEMGVEEAVEAFSPHLEPYLGQILAAGEAFAAAKKASHLVDYDDLLFKCEQMIIENRDLRQSLHQRWRHVLVDEYQDTNAVQARLVRLLAGPGGNVMAVGDDAQSIYAFRGARLDNILEFPQTFPKTRLVKLEQNYRSTQSILDLTNQVISRAERRYEKNLFTERGQGAAPELLRPREQRGQSRLVAERVAKLLASGESPGEIAVLFRAGRDSFDLESELKASHIPYVKYGGLRFVELAHVKDVMCHLRIAANPQDFLSWQRALMLLKGVGVKTAQGIIAQLAMADGFDACIDRLAAVPQAGRIAGLAGLAGLLKGLQGAGRDPAELVGDVLEYYEPFCQEAYEDYPRRLKDLEELPALAQGYESLTDFVAEVVLDPPEAQADDYAAHPITLSTVHSAKGKEWKHVFILWVTDGRMPAFPSLDDPRALEEELRLFYVACTRAANNLVLVSPREQYYEGTGWRPAPPSRFVDDLPQGLVDSPKAGPVFPVAAPDGNPGAPASRGSRKQDRPFEVGSRVRHKDFGSGKVMGYKGRKKILVYFDRLGLKTLLWEIAGLEQA